MTRLKALLSCGPLLFATLAAAQPTALEQLRAASESSQAAVRSGSSEGASAGGRVWAENAAYAGGAPAVSRGESGARSGSPAAGAPTLPAPKPVVVAEMPAAPAPKTSEPDPVPPKVRGWEGFKQGFMGTEALGLRLLSKTGPLTIPLLVLLQPIIAPIGLIAGLLGIFGVRL